MLVDGERLHLIRARDDVSDIVSAYRLPGDRSLPAESGAFSISVRISSSDAHYGGGIVDGAHVLKLFGDAVTGLAATLDGDESLLRNWEHVDFLLPVRPGDFITVKARITKRKRLRRFVEVEALRTVRALDADSSSVEAIDPPERVAFARGLIVIPILKGNTTSREAVE